MPRNPGSTDDRRRRSIKCHVKYWGLHLIDGGVEVLGLDSTSVEVHPDGTGVKRDAKHRQIARRMEHEAPIDRHK